MEEYPERRSLQTPGRNAIDSPNRYKGSSMPLAAIALGSNLSSPFGDRAANLREATSRIAHLGVIRAVSGLYDTAPVGYTDQPRFLNAALLLETALAPTALMQGLLAIEHAMGRDRNPPTESRIKGPRIIDLDLLLVDAQILDSPVLTLPHPEMAHRRFVLEPLAEIAPGLLHPVTGLTIAELLARLA